MTLFSNLDQVDPKIIAQFLSGNLSRRSFLRATAGASIGLSLSSILGCIHRVSQTHPTIDGAQDKELSTVLSTLLPSETHSPGAKELNASAYFQFVLLDPSVDEAEKQLILDGLNLLSEHCLEKRQGQFSSLPLESHALVLAEIIESDWGESWCSLLIDYLFEALLSDPIYGGNTRGLGWNWLKHTPGAPRPQARNQYPQIKNAASGMMPEDKKE